ncbi:MAG: hypothetical protein ACRDRT_10780, partial [Pseudonocardiaceae bacterium]
MTNGPVKSQPARSSRPAASRPAALTVACILGLIGGVLLLAGVAGDERWLLLVGLTAGCGSLVAALVWRSQLIEAW